MQVLRLLAAARRRQRRAVSTITAARSEVTDDISEVEEDDGPFFDLDFSSSVRASSSTSSSSASESDDACSDLDFVISLHRSRTASPAFFFPPPPLELCASAEPAGTKPGLQSQYGEKRLRSTLSSFGANKNKAAFAFYGGRPSFASSARSLRLFMESPTTDDDDDEEDVAEAHNNHHKSGDVIRRYLTKIFRRRSVRTRGAGDARGAGIQFHPQQRRLRKSRSASAAVVSLSRRDDSVIEKQDGIASAIAHCKESLHRASLSECDSSLLRSRSDPGKCEAASSSSSS